MKTSEKYDIFSKVYDFHEKPLEKLLFSGYRKDLVKNIKGKVLEIGVGTGKNLPYYPEDTDLTAIDFSEGMLKKAQQRLDGLNLPDARLINMDVENLQFDDASFDTIIISFVFCTVPDPVKGLKEVKRVLKPEGNAYFIEHMRSNSIFINLFLYSMNLLISPLTGTSMVRRTKENFQASGLKIIEEKNLFSDFIKFIKTSPD